MKHLDLIVNILALVFYSYIAFLFFRKISSSRLKEKIIYVIILLFIIFLSIRTILKIY